MNKKTILTISKSAIIILILLAVVFALRAPAADLNILPTGDLKAEYEDASVFLILVKWIHIIT